MVSGFTPVTMQHFTGSTSAVYHSIAKKRGQTPNTVNLYDGAQGHWIGSPNAKQVLLYFHGGGYIGSATPGHLIYLFHLQQQLANQGHDVAIFVLRYTLAPKGVFPIQLRQAVSALEHLLTLEKRSPSDILVGGDSAGGNLTSVLLLHLARPHPQVPVPEMSGKLRAAVLLSPWVNFDYTKPSFTKNQRLDYITREALTTADNYFVGPGKLHDDYSQPGLASAEWWSDVADRVVSQILIWGGGDEILIDGIREYAATITKGFAQDDLTRVDPEVSGGTELRRSDKLPSVGATYRVTYIETDKHVHIQPIFDFILRAKKNGRSAQQVQDWISSKL